MEMRPFRGGPAEPESPIRPGHRTGRRLLAIVLLTFSLGVPTLPAAAAPTSPPSRAALAVGVDQASVDQASVDQATISRAPSPPLGSAAVLAALASAPTPAQAVADAHVEAAANGINDYISVLDRNTGAVLAQSGSSTQVASESIMKLMLASYYLVLVGGYQNQSADVLDNLSYMIRYSDDATADEYFTSAAIPTIADRYGMGSTINATDRVGHWGAARITAADMTTFLFRASRDPEVGPWLLPVMAQVAPVGSDGFDQAFGMNSLSGPHGSKQGWGDDEFFSSASNVINSVGYTDRYFVAILQNSYSYPDPARETSTYAAQTVAASRLAVSAPPPPPSPPVLHDGDFVQISGTGPVYRLAGGAPVFVSDWRAFGGVQPVKRISQAQWNTLPTYPRDGAFLEATGSGEVYLMVQGAAVYVSNWAAFGGRQPVVVVDAAALVHAGLGGAYVHLRGAVPDGVFLEATGSHEVFRMAGGAPVYVSSWAAVGGARPTHLVDGQAIAEAGAGGRWSHLLAVPRNGTYLVAAGSLYRTAGGAPLYIASLAGLGALSTPVAVDPMAVARSGQGGVWVHLNLYPWNGTFLLGELGDHVYRVVGGQAVVVRSWAPYGGVQPYVRISEATVLLAGRGGKYNHLRG